jgi:hypothetical protein
MPRLHRRPTLCSVAPPSPPRRARDAVVAALEPAALVVAIVFGGAVATVLLLLLLTVAAPLGFAMVAWIVWRSDRELVGALARLRARWGRSARVITSGLESER